MDFYQNINRNISIHLMLLFIGWIFKRTTGTNKISIHLMLLFIVTVSEQDSLRIVFQYISCYCLSLPGRIVSILTTDFNTSHVTVYPSFSASLLSSLSKFQYISCYCLSLYRRRWDYRNVISIHLMLLFIIPFRIRNIP